VQATWINPSTTKETKNLIQTQQNKNKNAKSKKQNKKSLIKKTQYDNDGSIRKKKP
jgi:hypothetical protein